ncbi:MAG: polysaccharide biosynthesis C-terminal domain-containing protein [Myxococcota bacterium]|nr:polysaccharide biosynthesis C-terminal domain-containing protein [Myxococcota bacterium]
MSDSNDGENPTLRQNARGALPYAVLSGALQILLSLVGMLLLVRYLSPDDFAAWTVMAGFGSPMILFTAFGFRHSLVRFMPTLNDRNARGRFLWGVIIRRGLWMIHARLVIYAALPLYSQRLGISDQIRVFEVLLGSFFLMACSQYLVIGLNVAFRQREVLVGSLILQALWVSGVLIGIEWQENLFFFGALQFLCQSVYLIFNLVMVARYLGPPARHDLQTRHTEAAEESHYRRTSFVDDLGNVMLSPNINRFIVAAFSTTSQVAIYSVAANIILRLTGLTPIEMFRPLASVTFFTRFEEKQTVDEVNRMFSFLLSANRVVTVAFLALFIPLGYEVTVWIFKAEYGPAYLPIAILLLSMGLFVMPIGLVAQALQRPKWLVYSKLAVLVNLGLGIPAAIYWGAAGMAAATAMSMLSKNAIVFVLLRREFPIRYPWRTTFRFLIAGLCVCILLWWLNGATHFLVAGALGTVIWLLALRLFRVLSQDERQLFVTILPNRFQRVATFLIGD